MSATSSQARAPPVVGRGDDAGDDGEDDQPEDVVDHRRAEDDARLPRRHLAEVGEDARGDADAGGAERGADEDVRQVVLLGQEPGCHAPTEEERRRHPQAGDEQARPADREHLAGVGLQSHLEEQQDDPELGEHLQPPVGAEELEVVDAEEREVAEDDAEDQLAEDRRLADALEQLAAELGGGEDHDQAEEDRHDRTAVGLLRGLLRRGRRRGGGRGIDRHSRGGCRQRAAAQYDQATGDGESGERAAHRADRSSGGRGALRGPRALRRPLPLGRGGGDGGARRLRGAGRGDPRRAAAARSLPAAPLPARHRRAGTRHGPRALHRRAPPRQPRRRGPGAPRLRLRPPARRGGRRALGLRAHRRQSESLAHRPARDDRHAVRGARRGGPPRRPRLPRAAGGAHGGGRRAGLRLRRLHAEQRPLPPAGARRRLAPGTARRAPLRPPRRRRRRCAAAAGCPLGAPRRRLRRPLPRRELEEPGLEALRLPRLVVPRARAVRGVAGRRARRPRRRRARRARGARALRRRRAAAALRHLGARRAPDDRCRAGRAPPPARRRLAARLRGVLPRRHRLQLLHVGTAAAGAAADRQRARLCAVGHAGRAGDVSVSPA